MRNTFVNRLADYAKKDKDMIMMVGDLGFGVLKRFYEEMPKQFVNAGIAEQNMASMAAGMALMGKKVYLYSIANFPSLRCIEQIRNDILYHNADVKIISVGTGLGYGSLGMSHHGTDDLGIMRSLPNLIIFSPGDPTEAKRVCELCHETPNPAYIRLGKGKEAIIHDKELKFKIGEGIKVLDGKDICILATGPICNEAYLAAKELKAAFYTFPTVKPIDEKLIKKCSKDYKLIVTVEEGCVMGGFAGAVSEVLTTEKNSAIQLKIGLDDTYVGEVGNQDYLRELYGLDSKSIVKKIKNFMKKEDL